VGFGVSGLFACCGRSVAGHLTWRDDAYRELRLNPISLERLLARSADLDIARCLVKGLWCDTSALVSRSSRAHLP